MKASLIIVLALVALASCGSLHVERWEARTDASTDPSVTTTPTTATTTPTTATTTPTTDTTITTTPTTVTTTPTTVTTTPTTVTTTPTTVTTTPTTVTTTPTTVTTTPTTVTTTPTTVTTTPTTVTTTPTTVTTTPTTVTTTPTTVTTTPTTVTTTPTTVTTTPTTVTTTPTTASTPSTASTAATTTAKPLTVTSQPQVVAIFKVEIASVNGVVTHTAKQMCSGTIVSSKAVLTTATCAVSATSATGLPIRILTNKYNATNLPNIPISEYYEVMDVELNTEYDAANNLRNLAILKMDTEIEYIDNLVSVVGWVEDPVPLNTQCIASFWSTATPYKQSNMNARIVACPTPTTEWQICADITAPATKACTGGEDGTSLICNGKIAGMLSATATSTCDVMNAKPFNELSADKPFLWNTVNAAPLVHFSATAFLAMVLVVIRNYC